MRVIEDGTRSGMLTGYISGVPFHVNWFTSGPPFDLVSYVLRNLIVPYLCIFIAFGFYILIEKRYLKTGIVQVFILSLIIVVGTNLAPSVLNFTQNVVAAEIVQTEPGFKLNLKFSCTVNIEVTRAQNISSTVNIIYVPDNHTSIQATINAAN